MSESGRASFAEVSRTIRSVLGFAQDDLAAHLEVSRKTVQRWERGLAAPDDRVESLLERFCQEHRLFVRAGRQMAELGVPSWEQLAALLSDARRGRAVRAHTSTSVELVGRDADVSAIRALLGSARLVTITGPGGIGKTSLARFVALRWPERTAIVELASVRAAELVLTEIAERTTRTIDPNGSVREQVIAALNGCDLLLLDNLEHLPASFPVIADLVESCPALRVLTTSRSPLRLRDEHVYRLGPLSAEGPDSDAARLFAARATRAGAPLQVDVGRNVNAVKAVKAVKAVNDLNKKVAAICRRLDGIPLAIELAAARLRVLSVDDLLIRLDRPLPLLAGGELDRPARQQSLRASLGWSVDLLENSPRNLLRTLSSFVGGWTLAAAEAVGEEGAFQDLADLVDAGLVERRFRRYAMTEPVRDYVAETYGVEHDRFVNWACAEAARVDAGLRVADTGDLLADFDAELANFRAALGSCLDQGEGVAAHRLCLALAGGWDAHSMLREARRWIELTLNTSADPFSDAALRNWLAYFLALQGEFDSARRFATQALAVWEAHHIEAGIGYACLVLGRVAAETEHFDDARALLARSHDAFVAADDQWGRVRPINALGELAREVGDLATAEAHHLQAAELSRSLGDEGSLPSILADLANVCADRQDGKQAIVYAEQALAIATRRANPVGVASALDALGRGYLHDGHPPRALEAWAEADAVRADVHHPVERRDRIALDRDRKVANTFSQVARLS